MMSTMSPSREPTPIDITRYAEVMAHLRHFPSDKHAEVIARMGIRRRDWDAAAAKWTRERDAERMTGKLDVTIRYGRVLSDTRARLSAVQPSIESLGPLPGPDGAAEQLGAKAATRTEPDTTADKSAASAEPAVEVPSYLAAEQHAVSMPDPLPLPLPSVSLPSRSMASTALGPSAPASAPTPFVASSSSEAEAFQRAVAHAAEVQGPAGTQRGAGTGTVGVSNESVASPPPAGVPPLTLEQYASLRVALDQAPENASATLERYGVAAGERDALDAYWKGRFTADPVLRMTFARTCAEFVAWFQAHPGVPRV